MLITYNIPVSVFISSNEFLRIYIESSNGYSVRNTFYISHRFDTGTKNWITFRLKHWSKTKKVMKIWKRDREENCTFSRLVSDVYKDGARNKVVWKFGL